MPKILDQEQIDVLVRTARHEAGTPEQKDRLVHPWDIHQANKIGREQLHAINALHEVFARNLGHSLAGYLRTSFECTMVSAEHLTFSEFLARVPEIAYLASCDLAPAGATAVLQIDLAVAFCIVDLLLGGEGKGAPPGREVTQIEEQILENIVRIICRELQVAWSAVSLEFTFAQREPVAQAERLMPPEEKNLCLSFETKISDVVGSINLAVPAVASNALLRKITGESYRRPKVAADARSQIQKRLERCPFNIELTVAGLRIPARELVDMTRGTILRFATSVSAPAALIAGSVRLGSATPVKINRQRAARVVASEKSVSSAGDR